LIVYPVLAGKIVERGLTKRAVASELNVTERTFNNRLKGKGDFSWWDVVTMQNKFFPDVEKDELMKKV